MFQHPDVCIDHVRSNALEATPLFADKPKIMNYTDDGGFAVPIYRPRRPSLSLSLKGGSRSSVYWRREPPTTPMRCWKYSCQKWQG
jgi:hypothetical protein